MGSIFTLAEERGVRFAAAVNPGNELVLESADFLIEMAQDPGIKVILMALEGVRDGRRFLRAAQGWPGNRASPWWC